MSLPLDIRPMDINVEQLLHSRRYGGATTTALTAPGPLEPFYFFSFFSFALVMPS
jgi:hypothetical protein